MPLFFRAEAKREFIRLPTDDLRGKTVGVVGLGGNGRAITKVLAPWDVRIIATDYFPIDQPGEVEQLWPADQLDRLLAESDIVILTLPLNANTRGLFDRPRIAKMRRGSYLINVARGAIIVEDDLVAALNDNHLSGVGLDVTEVEPLAASSRLWDDPRVIITPHVGAQSSRRNDDATDLVCVNSAPLPGRRRTVQSRRQKTWLSASIRGLAWSRPMSSNRAIPPCDAFLQRGEQPAGPIRLPMKDSRCLHRGVQSSLSISRSIGSRSDQPQNLTIKTNRSKVRRRNSRDSQTTFRDAPSPR